MYLLIGSELDPCCRLVSDALDARDLEHRIISGPFTDSSRLSWYLDNNTSFSRLTLSDGTTVNDVDIDGVLVHNTAWLNPEGWQPDDLAYIHLETQAALLGWLWGLRCPVVGRLESDLWYQPQAPLAFWQPLLSRCGLLTPEVLVTNIDREARAFGERMKEGAVYAPFTTPARYLVEAEADWSGIAMMQSYSPVCLAQPHGETQAVCVVGQRVVWDGALPPEAGGLESGLRRFARESGLSFVELASAKTASGTGVVSVDPLPCFWRFGEPARLAIVEALMELFKAGAARGGSNASTQTC